MENARRKKKKEHKGKNAPLSKLLNEHAPLLGCWVNQDWKTGGTAYLFVARKMATGLVMFSSFWIDTVKKIVTHCFFSVNLTEESFRREYLEKHAQLKFFNIEMDLVKEILSDVLAKKNPLPEEYAQCVRLIGTIRAEESEYLEKKEEERSQSEVPRFHYRISDCEMVEAEIRQIPELEEMEESSPEERRFAWIQREKGWFSSKKSGPLGFVVLKKDILVLEVLEEQKGPSLNHSLLQYLGTCVSPITK